MTFNTPSKSEVIELLEELLSHVNEDMEDGMDITIASDGKVCDVTGSVDWNYQTGDNSYTGGCYGYWNWAVGTIEQNMCDCDIEDLALNLIDQLEEGLAYDALHRDCR